MRLKYVNYDIVFQEIPDEVTLAINLSNCPNRCHGCHSPYLQQDIGEPLSEEVLSKLIDKYGSAITCMCFMGGDAAPEEVIRLLQYVKETWSYKTAWYSGCNVLPSDLQGLDYIKIGEYKEELGGLSKITTNQRLYKITNTLEDITFRFRKCF
ncbi:MAG: anaerobic ribonucleoside-triphosphate reductase activating protein [Rikenellaceae bacterium]